MCSQNKLILLWNASLQASPVRAFTLYVQADINNNLFRESDFWTVLPYVVLFWTELKFR
jgi:hypothetical protein